MQARHIPELLSFISENDGFKHHIWMLEEPENSLSYASALDLAKRLEALAEPEDRQLFVTTHSPAFYLENSTNTTRFAVTHKDDVSSVRNVTSENDATIQAIMGQEFYLPDLARHLEAKSKELAEINEWAAELSSQIKQSEIPVLFVEGKHDIPYIELALSEWGLEDKVLVQPLGSASHAKTLHTSESGVVNQAVGNKRFFVLLDNDGAGLNAVPGDVRRQCVTKWSFSAKGGYWRVLDIPPAASKFFKRHKIGQDHQQVEIEDMASVAFRESYHTRYSGDFSFTRGVIKKHLSYDEIKKIEESGRYNYASAITDSAKERYSKEACENSSDSVITNLNGVFEELNELVAG